MLTGVSTACFYPQLTEQALQKLVSINVQACELFINSAYELAEEYLHQIRKTIHHAGIKVLSIHPYTSAVEPLFFFSEYDRRFEEGLELYKKYFYAAAYLGAKLVVFHGNFKRNPMQHNLYYERFLKIREAGRKMGIELCQENVSYCYSGSLDFFKDMKRQIPDISFVLDTKQVLRAGGDILEYSAELADNIGHIHISDNDKTHDCMIPGDGTFNIGKFCDSIKENKIIGGCIVELYAQNYKGIVDISRGYQHISSAFQH